MWEFLVLSSIFRKGFKPDEYFLMSSISLCCLCWELPAAISFSSSKDSANKDAAWEDVAVAFLGQFSLQTIVFPVLFS